MPTQTPTPSLTPTATPTPTPAPTNTPTPTPLDTPTPTQISTPNPTSTPSPTPKPTPSPQPIFNSTTLQATFNNSTIDIGVNGITALAVTNAAIKTDQTANQTTLSLTIIGQNTTNDVNVITVPKIAVLSGETPKIYVNTQVALDQGFSQDSNNYYVWYKTEFRDYELSIIFAQNASSDEFPLAIILAIVAVVVFSMSIAAALLKKRKVSTDDDLEYSNYF